MNILIAGFGSIGQRHLKNLMDNYPDNSYNVLKFSNNEKVIQNCKIIPDEVVYDYYKGVKFFSKLNSLDFNKIDAAFICNDASKHLDVAFDLIEYDIDLFIEKPIDIDIDKILDFKSRLLKSKSRVVIGYQTQFHPIFLKMKFLINQYRHKIKHVEIKWANYLPMYHPYEDYTVRNSGKKSLGGGVLLALSHEINAFNSIFPEARLVYASVDSAKEFKIDTEDFAHTIFEENNIKIDFLLGYSQVHEERYIKVQMLDKYIVGDYLLNKVTVYDVAGVSREYKFKLERNELFVNELNYFFECIKTDTVEFNNIDESIKDIKLINFIKNEKR